MKWLLLSYFVIVLVKSQVTMKQRLSNYGRIMLGIIGGYYFFLSLYNTKAFLIPLTTAFILALVMLPLAKRLEELGVKRMWGSICCTLVVLLISLGMAALVAYQSKVFANQWPSIKATLEPQINTWQAWIVERTPLTQEQLSPSIHDLFKVTPNPGSQIAGAVGAILGFLGNYLLTVIYVFFLLQYRARFRTFVLRIFPDKERTRIDETIQRSARIAPQYLIGKLILMAGLAVLYGIGLGVSGVDNFVLISLVAAVLTLIPYVGNVLGFGLAMAFGYLTTGDTGILIGIMLTFGVGQFIESYILQPFVVGDKVDVHPFFTILVVVAGNFLWGVVGTILSIPLLGILTVVLLNVPSLHSIGLLLSTKDFSARTD